MVIATMSVLYSTYKMSERFPPASPTYMHTVTVQCMTVNNEFVTVNSTTAVFSYIISQRSYGQVVYNK